MKNNTETKILLCLLVFAILYFFYSYLLSPKIAENKELEEEIDTEETQVMAMYATAALYDSNVTALKEHKASLQKQVDLFYTQDDEQEDFINMLHRFFTSEEMQLRSIKSADYELTEGIEYPNTQSPYMVYFPDGDLHPQALYEDTEMSRSLPHLEKMEIEFQYIGTYAKIHQFLQRMKSTEKFTTSSKLSVKLVQGDDLYNAETDREIVVTISFLRPYNMTMLNVEPENMDSIECNIPEKLADGSYRDMYTFANFSQALKALFSGD